MEKQKREKVVSFRLSEQEYARDLSMAKLWYENDLTNKPDCIVHSCINGVPRAIYHFLNPSTREKHEQDEQQQEKEGGVERQDPIIMQ